MLSEGRAIPRNPAAARREWLAALQQTAARVLPRPRLARRMAPRRTSIRWQGGIVALALAATLTVLVEQHPPVSSIRGVLATMEGHLVVAEHTVESRVHPAAVWSAVTARARAAVSSAAADVRAHLPISPSTGPSTPSAPSSAAVPRRLVVANTGGRGVNVRAAPGIGRIVLRAWPDGTVMMPTGAVTQAAGRQWLQVRDPANELGWVVAAYVEAR